MIITTGFLNCSLLSKSHLGFVVQQHTEKFTIAHSIGRVFSVGTFSGSVMEVMQTGFIEALQGKVDLFPHWNDFGRIC